MIADRAARIDRKLARARRRDQDRRRDARDTADLLAEADDLGLAPHQIAAALALTTRLLTT